MMIKKYVFLDFFITVHSRVLLSGLRKNIVKPQSRQRKESIKSILSVNSVFSVVNNSLLLHSPYEQY